MISLERFLRKQCDRIIRGNFAWKKIAVAAHALIDIADAINFSSRSSYRCLLKLFVPAISINA